jgi:hypothetical protein
MGAYLPTYQLLSLPTTRRCGNDHVRIPLRHAPNLNISYITQPRLANATTYSNRALCSHLPAHHQQRRPVQAVHRFSCLSRRGTTDIVPHRPSAKRLWPHHLLVLYHRPKSRLGDAGLRTVPSECPRTQNGANGQSPGAAAGSEASVILAF